MEVRGRMGVDQRGKQWLNPGYPGTAAQGLSCLSAFLQDRSICPSDKATKTLREAGEQFCHYRKINLKEF